MKRRHGLHQFTLEHGQIHQIEGVSEAPPSTFHFLWFSRSSKDFLQHRRDLLQIWLDYDIPGDSMLCRYLLRTVYDLYASTELPT